MFTGQISLLVAGVTVHAIDAVAVIAALDVLHVDVTVVALQRGVTGGVAVLAARRDKNFVNLQKSFAGSVCVRLWRTRRSRKAGYRDTKKREGEWHPAK